MAKEKKVEQKWPSYTMVEERMRKIYFQFYHETYKRSKLDRKTKELIAIAASLAYHCQGCLEGHVQKAIKNGATPEEISEAICITMGVAAASVVDQTDKISEKLGLKHFE
ncbi:MAG: carboxymuconolactone decarboxylase family protein [Acidobacteria bacterium]|nr:carboxymuconolactone decarboxylase family protein [Acidobacteriota bacterium]